MAFFNLPIAQKKPDQEFSIELEGVVYVFRFRFNFRENLWSFDVSTEAGVLIVGGVPVVGGINLLDRFAKSELPPGQIFVIDSFSTFTEIDFDNLGVTHFLVYRESTT